MSVERRIDMTLLTDSLVRMPMKSGQQPVFVGFHMVLRIMLSWFVIASLLPSSVIAGPERTGEEIYRRQCAACHGAIGEGTDDHYPRPLVGERSVPALARLIAKTMPDDAPGECVGEDADRVAAYIYETFYSKSAQARAKFQGPRIELSRLTVRQYRSSLADLVGSFQGSARWDDQRGLKAEYSSRSRRRRGGNGGSSLNRVDPEVRLEFGENSPIAEQAALKDIAMRWQKAPVLLVPLSAFQGVFAGVSGQLARIAARSGDRRIRVPGQDGKCHAFVGQ